MEVKAQRVVGHFQHIHFKDQLGGLGEQGLFQTLQTVGAALLYEVSTLTQTAPADGCAAEVPGVQAPFLCLVAQQIQPEGPVAQLIPDGHEKGIFVLGFIPDDAHKMHPPFVVDGTIIAQKEENGSR